MLKELAEERQHALEDAEISAMRIDARLDELRAWWRYAWAMVRPAFRTRWRAECMELRNNIQRAQALVAAAARELATINELLAEVRPLRKFAHLPEHQAHQAAQEEQWLLELQWRAENCFVAMGTIPPEQLEVMRLHPAWATHLRPKVTAMLQISGAEALDSLPGRLALTIEEGA